MTIRIGTRASELARTQTTLVIAELRRAHAGLAIEEVLIRTTGDADQTTPLDEQGGIGLFTKELERALLAREIDIAVHSLKDLPTALAPGLLLGAVPERASPWDAWISEEYPDLIDLPEGAAVMSGSLRRRSQVLNRFPRLRVEGIRGNIDTRIAKYREKGGAGLILAEAGLNRTGRQRIVRGVFSPTEMTPAPGQGALGIEVRADDAAARELVHAIEHAASRTAVDAERALLRRLEAGCQMPVGGIARVVGEYLSLLGMVALPDGSKVLRMADEGSARDPEELGTRLAEKLLHGGAGEILATIRGRGVDPAAP